MLPQLRKLEHRFPDELLVISVHSPKFPRERETPALRQAVLRHRIEHPVLNDAEFTYWQQFGARAWPTLYFVDPNGNVIGRHEGEITADAVGGMLEGWIAEYRSQGLLRDTPLPLERASGADSPLSFPAKVHYDAASELLFVADSNHDRVIAARLDGTVVQVIGAGAPSVLDGGPEEARFDQPHGMAVAEDAGGRALFVADLENHAIRRVDLGDWQTTTVAGTGEQSRVMPQLGPAAGTSLNSPWDLATGPDDTIYVAMAGVHQLWALDLRAGTIGPWAGSMREGIVDGALVEAELAQPSGLSIGGGGVAFADSESNAIRLAGFGEGGRVQTLIGSGPVRLRRRGRRRGRGAAAASAGRELGGRGVVRGGHVQPQTQAGLPADAAGQNAVRGPGGGGRVVGRGRLQRTGRDLRGAGAVADRGGHEQSRGAGGGSDVGHGADGNAGAGRVGGRSLKTPFGQRVIASGTAVPGRLVQRSGPG